MRGRIVRVGIVLGIILTMTPLRPALAGGGGCRGVPMSSANTNKVVLQTACFAPTIARIPVGQTVTWFNKDPFAHTVTGANLIFGSFEEKGVDAVWKSTFDRPGIYPYYCYLHAGMVGTIVVGSDSQLLGQLRKGVLDVPENVVDTVKKTPVTPVATKAKESTSAWPATAAGIGLASVGLGFGFGRRAGRNGHTVPGSSGS